MIIKTNIHRCKFYTHYCVWFESKPLITIQACVYNNINDPIVSTSIISSLTLKEINMLLFALNELIDTDKFGERN